MFHRYFVLAVTSTHKQYLLAPTCLFLLIIVSQNVHSQQQIALDTYAIFQQSCLICHGPDGAYKESFLMEHNAFIEKGRVVPGNPDASELYRRLISIDIAKRMSLGQLQRSAQAIDTIHHWILAAAPDWTAPPTTDHRFISPGEILNTIETHLMSLAPFDRAFARYFTMSHLSNAGEPQAVLKAYRSRPSRLINSLSWEVTVTNPQPIDPQGIIFYIDLRHYKRDRNGDWTKIESDASEQSALKTRLTRLQR